MGDHVADASDGIKYLLLFLVLFSYVWFFSSCYQMHIHSYLPTDDSIPSQSSFDRQTQFYFISGKKVAWIITCAIRRILWDLTDIIFVCVSIMPPTSPPPPTISHDLTQEELQLLQTPPRWLTAEDKKKRGALKKRLKRIERTPKTKAKENASNSARMCERRAGRSPETRARENARRRHAVALQKSKQSEQDRQAELKKKREAEALRRQKNHTQGM